MKNAISVHGVRALAIIAFVAIIGFSMAACGGDDPEPTPTLSGDITISPTGPVTTGTELTATYSGTETVSYQWKNNSYNTDVGTNSNKFTPTEEGDYTVTVSAEGYYSKTSNAVTVTAGPKWTAVADSKFGTSAISGIYLSKLDGTLFAVGANGKIAYSKDSITTSTSIGVGETWTLVEDSKFGTNTIIAISFVSSARKYIAVGGSGKMATSADGTTWTAVADSKFDTYIGAIAYTDQHGHINGDDWSRAIAVGGNGIMAYSADGETWTAVEDSKFGTSIIYAIARGEFTTDNGMFRLVAGGGDGKMAYSDDAGKTWTAVENSTFGTSTIRSIIYANDKFFAAGDNEGVGKMAYSSDGITWTAVADSTITGTASQISSIAYGNGKFVAVGGIFDGRSVVSKAATSTDGITWTAISDNTFGSTIISGVVFNGKKFFAVSPNGKIAYLDNF